MAGSIVYDGVPRTGVAEEVDRGHNSLFSGQKLWFSHRVPQRTWLIENAQANGAVIVGLDKDADVILVDHARKDSAPGTHSYKYVEHSIRNGKLEDLAQHVVGIATRVSRPVGSTATAPKNRRTPFTAQDDQLLWDWVKPYEENGGAWKGNEIYKQLENVNPRHTYQSWRDRWIKTTRFQKRTTTSPLGEQQAQRDSPRGISSSIPPQRKRRRQVSMDAEPAEVRVVDRTAPLPTRPEQAMKKSRTRTPELSSEEVSRVLDDETAGKHDQLRQPPEKQPRILVQNETQQTAEAETETESDLSGTSLDHDGAKTFTKEEFEQLYQLVPKVTSVSSEHFKEAWDVLALSEDWTGHSPKEWMVFYETKVVPEFCRRNGLTMEKIAPYLAVQEEYAGPSTANRRTETQKRRIDNDADSEGVVCFNCFTPLNSRWRNDRSGRPVCKECAILLRMHWVQRPSTTWTDVTTRQQSDNTPNAQVRRETAHAKISTQHASTPKSNYVNRGTSPYTPEESWRRVDPDSTEDSGLKSPSYRPPSPTAGRPPEPNEARKRSADRNGSQSNSTSQESRKGNSQSQHLERVTEVAETGVDLIHGPRMSKVDELPKGNTVKPHTALVPPIQSPTSGNRNKQKLQDEPGNIEFVTQSRHDSDASVEDYSLPPLHPSKTTPQKRRKPRSLAPLFVSDNEDSSLEADDEYRVRLRSQASASPTERLVEHTSPLDIRLISDGSIMPATLSSSPSESSPSQNRQEGRASFTQGSPLDGVTPEPQSRRKNDRFETAPESMEDFETAAEGYSEGSSQRKRGRERRLSTQALFQRVNDGQDDLLLELELPEPAGGWDRALGGDYGLEKEHDDRHLDSRGHDTSAGNGNGEGNTRPKPSNDTATSAHFQVTSPNAEPEPTNMSATPSPQSSGIRISRWLASRQAEHSDVHRLTLRHILLKALKATSFDFDLASEVVESILDRLPATYRRRDEYTPNPDIRLPPDVRGVWTAEDDNLLRSDDRRDIEIKHGQQHCDARMNFLEQFG